MIKAINSTNFKSVIIPKYPKLSESQEKVVDDIKTKLGDKAEKKHFLITPLKDDVVELSEVYNVKKIGNVIVSLKIIVKLVRDLILIKLLMRFLALMIFILLY